MGSVIDQSANFRAQFGAVYRSSAIFLVPENARTTLSVSNYWDFKNQIDVGILVTQRTLKGKVVSRQEYRFDEANVLNIPVRDVCPGSVEIESFASRNLRIPYSAVMAVYETESSISMVHSYGRNHSLIELEDSHCLTQGRESGWSLRAAHTIRNSAVFHNGHLPVEQQTATLIVTNTDGEEHVESFVMPTLEPFETWCFDVQAIWPAYRQHLAGQDGWATVHFENSTAFTRLLVMWQDEQSGQLQVTHSNFDYTEHQTNVNQSDNPAWMKLPQLSTETLPDAAPGALSVAIYPRFMPGQYEVSTEGQQRQFDKGMVLEQPGRTIAFRRLDGALPARIVTGIVGDSSHGALPFECSLGVLHDKRPPKRFHWALISRRLQSRIHITHYPELYDPGTDPIELVVSLYNADNRDIATRTLSFPNLSEVPDSLDPQQLFAEALSELENDLACVSVFSHYGGLFLFSSLQKGYSCTLEHSF